MKNNHTCYTYFKIVGNFDPHIIIDKLNIVPNKVEKIGEQIISEFNNKAYVCEDSYIQIGLNHNYDVNLNNMFEVTIKDLRPKIKELIDLKNEIKAIEYFLVAVPEIKAESEHPNPLISLTKEMMKFLVDIDGEIDIDYYII